MLMTSSLHVIELQISFIPLKKKHNLKIKGEGPLKYHLGCDYHMDPDGTLVSQPKKYISKILDSFHQMFPDENLPQVKSPLDKNDHPELDNSDLASDDLITKFMCMVGQLQWSVTLGRYDILAHVMSMSRFRLAPKVGHIERMKRIYGYLSRTKHYALKFRTDEPNYITSQILSMIQLGSMVMSLKRYPRMLLNLLENQ